MADNIERDIVVDTDEWDDIMRQLSEKDKAIKDMLDTFIEALDILVNEGFKQGNRHDNMEVFANEVKNIRSQMEAIYSSAESAVKKYKSNSKAADKYLSLLDIF